MLIGNLKMSGACLALISASFLFAFSSMPALAVDDEKGIQIEANSHTKELTAVDKIDADTTVYTDTEGLHPKPEAQDMGSYSSEDAQDQKTQGQKTHVQLKAESEIINGMKKETQNETF